MKKVIVVDSHPVQYRVPIWRELSELNDINLNVVYASDCSVRGYEDTGFGAKVTWDDPMLDGYAHTFLDERKKTQPNGFFSLKGNGIRKILTRNRPDYVLLTGLNYLFDWKSLLFARLLGIRIGLRCETQDEATEQRGFLKETLRRFVYRILYSQIDDFYYIGDKNRKHYLKLGIPRSKLIPAYYFTVNRYKGRAIEEKLAVRESMRERLEISDNSVVIGFSGKFIDKKNPMILFEMLHYLPKNILERVILYFVGSGELANTLQKQAKVVEQQTGVKSIFTGFVNQSEIGNHYLAMDLFVLPSRRMGETWGLVVNEALQAGCSVVVSDAVGCSEDFKELSKFRVFETNNERKLSEKIAELALLERDFDWCEETMRKYSLETTVSNISKVIETEA